MRIESACSYFRRRESSVLPMPEQAVGSWLAPFAAEAAMRPAQKESPDIKGE